jgi:uncharacterized protein
MTSIVARRFVFALLFLAAGQVVALDVPSKPPELVNDYGANVLTASERQELEQKIEQMRARTGVPMLVMIWPSLEGEDAPAFTRRVANMWEVSDDRALMLLVFVNDRKTFIQVSRGLRSVVSDSFAADVIRNTLAPRFRQQQFYAGIDAAIDRLAAKIEAPPAVAPSRPTEAVQTPLPLSSARSESRSSDVLVFVVGIVILVLVLLALSAILRANGGSSRRGSGIAVWAALDSLSPPADFTSSSAVPPSTPASTPFVSSSDSSGFSASSGAGSSSPGGSWGGGESSFDGNGAGGSW